jgi:hypothetical protein
MEEEYEKNTSSAEGLVDYRAAGLLVSGCKRGKEQLERPVQSSYQEKLNEDFLSTAPDSGQGRVYMKRLCSLALAIALLATMFAPFAAARAAGFTDVTATYWAHDDIMYLSQNGIAVGYTDGTFRPEGKVTREEFAKMIVVAKKLALVKPARPTFTDVSSSRWSYGYVEAAVKAGYVKGVTSTTYAPAAPIKRQDLAVLLVRAAGKEQTALSAPVNAIFANDQAAVGAYALPDLAYAVSPAAQFLVWDTKRNINPVSPATRADCAHGIYMSLFPPKTFGDSAIELVVKNYGHCRTLAPETWVMTGNDLSTACDIWSPDKEMHAGWWIAFVYSYMYPTIDDFINAWMPMAGYKEVSLGSGTDLGYGFTQRTFEASGTKGCLFYKTYDAPALGGYIVSTYFANTTSDIWDSQGAIPSFVALSIRAVSQLRPDTSTVVSGGGGNPSSPDDNPEVDLSAKWQEAIMGFENVYSPSTGEHYEAPLTSEWDTGPEGPGYYRDLPGGGYEKLEPGFGGY